MTVMKRSRRFLWIAIPFSIFLIVAAIGSYTWYTVVRPCDINAVNRAAIILLRQRDRYDHTYQFATSAARDAIVRPVGDLQQILMDTQGVPVPSCLQTAKDELIDYMGTVIRAFQAFGAQETDSAVRELIDQSETHYDSFAAELEAVRECAPFCIR
jgi:hypothetical protein